MAVRRLKGDARMAELLRRALEGRRRPPRRGRERCASASPGPRFDRGRVNELVATIAARPAPYKAGRLALRARLVSEARRVFRSSARLGADEAWFEGELTRDRRVRGSARHALAHGLPGRAWCATCSRSRAQLERFAAGIFSAEEWQLLLRTRERRPSSTTAWSVDDLALLDEAAS